MAICAAGASRMIMNARGDTNFGGSTPETWSLGAALGVGNSANALWGEGDYAFHMMQNVYYNSGYKYTHTDEATQYQQADGQHYFRTAPSGTKDAAATLTNRMVINNVGGITTDGQFCFMKTNSTTTASMTFRKDTNTDADNIDYLQCRRIDNTAMLIIAGTGNVTNVNNSYGATSDVKLKENIADASSQWDDIKAVKVRKYSFKSENADTSTQIGVIAQELEASGMGGLIVDKQDEVFDERKTITDDRETIRSGEYGEDGAYSPIEVPNPEFGEQIPNPEFGRHLSFADTVTKEVKYSVLYMKSIKALQEAMTRIEALETKVTALENA